MSAHRARAAAAAAESVTSSVVQLVSILILVSTAQLDSDRARPGARKNSLAGDSKVCSRPGRFRRTPPDEYTCRPHPTSPNGHLHRFFTYEILAKNAQTILPGRALVPYRQTASSLAST